MRRAAFAAALAGVALPAAAAAAPPKVLLTLVDPSTTLSAQPPLTGAVATGEQEPHLFRQRVFSHERVAVGVDDAGRPVSVVVVQRLRVVGTGDYLFIVPAPVAAVTPTVDSESEPGQRQGAIRWAGFSTNERLLGARARLITARAAPVLPLKLALSATAGGSPLQPGERADGAFDVRLTLRNVTGVKAPTASASAELTSLIGPLDRARRGVFPAGGVAVTVRTPVAARSVVVEAPLRVTGELVFPDGRIERAAATGGRLDGNRVRFSVLLGDGLPLTHVVRVTGRAVGLGVPRIRVDARSVDPVRTLAPPGASSWAEAFRLNPRLDSRHALTVAEDAFLRAARAAQYDTYLANPMPAGSTNTADYVYATAPRRVATAAPPGSDGIGAAGLALAILGGVVVLGGLAVGWAHL